MMPEVVVTLSKQASLFVFTWTQMAQQRETGDVGESLLASPRHPVLDYYGGKYSKLMLI